MAAVIAGVLLIVLAAVVPVGWSQSNVNDPIIPNKLYMDSHADCNGPVREIYGRAISIIGKGAISEQDPPTSCSIIIKSSSNFDQTNLRIQVIAATIQDCQVMFTLFDGDGQGMLRGYDCRSAPKPNEKEFVTTGDTATFTLTRTDGINSQFDIEVLVTPINSGVIPGDENNQGGDWGVFREKLQNDVAIGIVGAVYLITVGLVVLGILLCYCHYKGLNKSWEQHSLSTFRPPASIYDTKSKMSDNSSGVWASNGSHARPQDRSRLEPKRHMARLSEDADSVFDQDDNASELPPKRRLEQERYEQDRHRERNRNRGFAKQNNSYVQADDDHPQNTFVERIIEPSVRSRRHHRRPAEYRDAVDDTETERSDLDEEEEEEEEVSDNQETLEEESEPASTEEEEEEEDDAPKPRPKPAARPQQTPPPPRLPQPYPPGMQPYMPGYAMGGYPMAPGQFVPVMAAPPNQPFPPGPRYPPPSGPRVRPTAPVYSHLVQRGYTSLEPDQGSHASLNTTHSNGSLDDSDKKVLTSGVEYMRR